MITSDHAASSSVDLKASTRLWGRRDTKPTVSTSSTAMPLGSTSLRLVGSRVANSMSASATLGPHRAFIRLDLPTLV